MPDYFRKIKDLAGFVANGSETTLVFSQDDATRTFHLEVGNKKYLSENSWEEVIDAAYADRPPEDIPF